MSGEYHCPVSPRERTSGEIDSLQNNCAPLAIKEFVNPTFSDRVIMDVCNYYGFSEHYGMTTDALILASTSLGLRLGDEVKMNRRHIKRVLKERRGTYFAFTKGYHDGIWGDYVRESHVFIIHNGAVIDRNVEGAILLDTPITSIIEILNP